VKPARYKGSAGYHFRFARNIVNQRNYCWPILTWYKGVLWPWFSRFATHEHVMCIHSLSLSQHVYYIILYIHIYILYIYTFAHTSLWFSSAILRLNMHKYVYIYVYLFIYYICIHMHKWYKHVHTRFLKHICIKSSSGKVDHTWCSSIGAALAPCWSRSLPPGQCWDNRHAEWAAKLYCSAPMAIFRKVVPLSWSSFYALAISHHLHYLTYIF
jgi:hypothetical protein